MATVYLQCPPSAADIAALRTGDLVYLSGEIVVTGGLPAHKRMMEYLDKDLPLPLKSALWKVGVKQNIDQRVAWARGDLIPMRYDWSAIDASATTATTLQPVFVQ